MLLVGFSGDSFLSSVAKRVGGEQPSLIQIDEDSSQSKHFPEVLVREQAEIRRYFIDNPALPSPTSESLSIVEHAMERARTRFNIALDRVFLDPLPMAERERYLFTSCSWWAHIVLSSGVNGPAFFAAVPHFPSHISLLAVLQATGANCFALRRTAFDSLTLIEEIVWERWPYRLPEIRRSSQPAASRDSKAPLGREAEDGYWSGYLARVNDVALRQGSTHRWLGALKNFARVLVYWWANPVRYFVLSRWSLVKKLTSLFVEQRNWNRFLTNVSQGFRFPLGLTAVFFLHAQPEASTVPEAGDYWYQPFAVASMSAALPPNWTLIVKEHPLQLGMYFRPDLRLTNYRSIRDYETVNSLENVKWAPATEKSLDLMEAAKIVVTPNGTVGWEALCAGIPVIVFSPTWYSSCEAVVVVGSANEARDAIGKLSALSRGEVLQMRQEFVNDLEHRGVRAPINGAVVQSDDEPQVFAENMAAELIKLSANLKGLGGGRGEK